ncbi:MAG: hypothetical protein OXC07_13260 [Kistimonas sp.]|nr:hypothetical protein [Kistimonas sp.]
MWTTEYGLSSCDKKQEPAASRSELPAKAGTASTASSYGRTVDSSPEEGPLAEGYLSRTQKDAPGVVIRTDPLRACAMLDPVPDRLVQRWPGCPDLNDPKLPINIDCVLSHDEPAEQQPPPPPFTPELEDDTALTDIFQNEESLTFIKEQLARRKEQEAQGLEFAFKPLMVTLRNMETFIDHIAQRKQFTQPLTAEEEAALGRIGRETRVLLKKNQALYKRTLRLSLSLMILCDIVTRRQVLEPYLKDDRRMLLCDSARLDPDRKKEPLLLAALPLTQQGPGGEQDLSACLPFNMGQALLEAVNNPNLLLYPSFHPLTVADFCKFCHLPVHPIGLITDYVMNADGSLRSPLSFAQHDLEHMEQLASVGYYCPTSPAMSPLCDSARRRDWRCLLLNRAPVCLATLLSQPALQLLAFQLLHEYEPALSARHMESSCSAFRYYLGALICASTLSRHAYEDIYQKITSDQAAIAVLWTVRLWSRWQAADYQLSQKALQDCAQTFLDTDLPQLRQHLSFFSEHQGTLRQLFAEQCSVHRVDADNEHTFAGYYGPQKEYVIFFSSYWPNARLRNVDNTIVVYFHSLCCAADRLAMEQRLGIKLPPGTATDPDGPQPATPEAMA